MSAPTVSNVAGTASGLSAADFRSIVEDRKLLEAIVRTEKFIAANSVWLHEGLSKIVQGFYK
jgi:hypothetical protein